MFCVTCQQPVENQPYRLIAVEKGTWTSLYAHRGACEDEARRVHRILSPVSVTREGEETAEAEELTMEAPDPFPESDAPWFGLERRR
jgi:hypothetical protein